MGVGETGRSQRSDEQCLTLMWMIISRLGTGNLGGGDVPDAEVSASAHARLQLLICLGGKHLDSTTYSESVGSNDLSLDP